MTEQQMLRSDTSDSSQSSDDLWRNEIQARLARYRTRRGRRIEGTYSMRFPFAPDEESPNLHRRQPMQLQNPKRTSSIFHRISSSRSRTK